MVVLSKCSDKYVLHGFTCYEVGHTWSASCLQAWKDVGFASYRTAFKIYLPLYLLALFLKKRGQNKKTALGQDLLKMFPELLRSTFFLGTNGLSFIITFCLWRKCFPFYYLFQVFTCAPPCSALSLAVERPDRRAVTDSFTLINTGFLPALTCSAMSVCFERKQRRSLLAVYMANIAVETVYLMLKTRKLIRPLPYGEILIFSLSTSFFCYMYQSNQISGTLRSGIRFLLGDADDRKAIDVASNLSSARQSLPSTSRLPQWARTALRALPDGGSQQCPTGRHQDSCLATAVYKFCRMFAFGFGLQAVLRLVGALASALQSVRRRRQIGALSLLFGAVLHRDSLRFGAFLGGLSGIYQAVGCLLARCHGNNGSAAAAAIGGLAAGSSLLAYRSSSLAMYCASKAVELACSLAAGAGWLPRLPHWDILLYALSTGIVFHCAVFEPHSLRPAYWQFLLRMTDGHFDDINRRILDGLNGGHSSLLKPDFWPQYDPAVTSLALGPDEMVRRLLANRERLGR